ncbi:MAG: PEBP family protein [Caldilinea sp. CFX5]|nr:PEBP family protein [Caldilinea sp. CFX5]
MSPLLLISLSLALLLVACRSEPATQAAPLPTPDLAAGEIGIKAEVWADNWFAFYLGKQLIYEDSVPITTERSFNAEVFTFAAAYPLTLNFVVKDFKENDTGLEYIGTTRQQMGDGGLIAQFTNTATGELIAATDATWVCLVTHKAPLDKACEQSANPIAGQPPCDFHTVDDPADWQTLAFDVSAWQPATVYSAAQVGAKEGYDEIAWNPSTQLIWSDDLESDNTLLCRLTVLAPQ